MAVDIEEYSFDLTETDRENLAQGDEKFQPHNWEDLKHIIANNNLSILKRKPSDLLRYMAWTNQTKATYGSITSFLCKERLQWQLASPEKIPSFDIDSPIAFESPKDYKILLNDWPYGISPDITHLIVWSKIRIPARKPEGYLTAESVALVEDFVRRTFVEPLASSRSVEGHLEVGISACSDRAKDDVLWFRNWTSLQSVRAIEHVHILVRDAPKDLIESLTGKMS